MIIRHASLRDELIGGIMVGVVFKRVGDGQSFKKSKSSLERVVFLLWSTYSNITKLFDEDA